MAQRLRYARESLSDEALSEGKAKVRVLSSDKKAEIGETLKRGREFSNLSMEEICNWANCSGESIERIENGRMEPEDLEAIVAVSQMIDWQENPLPGAPRDVLDGILQDVFGAPIPTLQSHAKKMLEAPRSSEALLRHHHEAISSGIERLLAATGENRLPEEFEMVENIPRILANAAMAVQRSDLEWLVSCLVKLVEENRRLREALASQGNKTLLRRFLEKSTDTAASAPLWIALLAAYGISGGHDISATLQHDLTLEIEECLPDTMDAPNNVPDETDSPPKENRMFET